ncbi:MAG: MFS transporter, partial [Stenotrophomonas sp.]
MSRVGQALPAGLVWLFAIASGLCVANVYYAQPLLDLLAASLGISLAAVGSVVTATQIGSALALLLLVPLGDRMERRRLMLVQLLGLVVALLWVAWARSPWLLLLGMLAIGLLGTAMTQGLIAYAASAAGDNERGRVVGAAQAGVFIGLLMARVVAGGVADLGGWRSVYIVSALAMLLLAGLLHRKLPRLPAAPAALGYL